MICTHCHGTIFLDTEDSRCPEYVCISCARRTVVNPPKGPLVPVELLKRRAHHKRDVSPEFTRRIKWNHG